MQVITLASFLVFSTPSAAFIPSSWEVSKYKVVGRGFKIADYTPAGSFQKLNAKSLCCRDQSLASSSSSNDNKPILNARLFAQNVLNQGVIGSTIWTGGLGAVVLTRNSNFEPLWILAGTLGAAPLLLFSNKVETSESPLFASLNLSTDMAALRLFGPRPNVAIAFCASAFMAGLTGLVEEVTFRGEILPQLAEWNDSGLLFGTIASTALFAVLHTNPLGFLKVGTQQFTDTVVLFGFQVCTGLIFALLFLVTGNLAVPIVAHAVYDFYTFFQTHLNVTTQMEYADKEKLMPIGKNAVEQKWSRKRGPEFVAEARETFYLMDRNRDGVVSRKELRVALFSYGIDLSKMESEELLRIADEDESGAIDFNEWLNLVGPTGSAGKAIKQSLLGMN